MIKRKELLKRPFRRKLEDNDCAICDVPTSGLVYVQVGAKFEILWASIVGANADNMINEFKLAMQFKTALRALDSATHPYSTTAESIRHAGNLYNKTRPHKTIMRPLRGLLKVLSEMDSMTGTTLMMMMSYDADHNPNCLKLIIIRKKKLSVM